MPALERGNKCPKNFLWKIRFIIYKGFTLSKHFLLPSVWGKGPQHSSPVRRYNEVYVLAGSGNENILSYLFPYPQSVKTNHNGRKPFLAKSSEQHERGVGERKKETVQSFTSLKITCITCWLLGFATKLVGIWTSIQQLYPSGLLYFKVLSGF